MLKLDNPQPDSQWPASKAEQLFPSKRVGHIDGLRAVAILAVIGYHAGWPGFGSGYVGVDIFFIISGYLIINQIVQRLQTGDFSIWDFYARRALRILPPFLLVLIVTLLIARSVLLSPNEWEWFGLSATMSALFVSNFYFLSKQGYFDLDMWEKTLLHTWSLSVEEQFYLLAPILLVLIFYLASRAGKKPTGFLGGAAAIIFFASLVGCVLFTSDTDKNYAFYLSPLRAWEFVLGGSIGFLMTGHANRFSPAVWKATSLIGAAMIFAAVSIDISGGFFPGIAATLPAIAAAMLIASGFAVPRAFVPRFLGSSPMVAIGLVSYGWYLWHWPLLSFARISNFGDPEFWRDQVMVLLSLVLAIATYFAIERPINRLKKHRDIRRPALRIFAGGVVACLVTAVIMGGVAGPAYLAAKNDPTVSGVVPAHDEMPDCDGQPCVTPENAGLGYLFGDSHTFRLREILMRETKRYGIPFLSIIGDREPQGEQLDYVIAINRWNLRFPGPVAEKELAPYLPAISDHGKRRLLVIGPVPEFKYRATECVLRAEEKGIDRDKCSLPRSDVEARRSATVAALKHITATIPNARYVDPIDLFCDSRLCRPYRDGVILYTDTDHLSRSGADYLYRSLKRDFVWAFTGKDY